MKTLKDMILKAADSANGLTYVWQGNEKYITYAELVSDARLTLHQMRGYGITAGAEIIIQVENDLDFLLIFWACILGGLRVVLLPYAKNQQAQGAIKLVLGMMENPYICVSAKENSKIEYCKKYNFSIGRVIEVSEPVSNMDVNLINMYDSKPDDVAVIQFSSGSTGTPKGVCTTHANILSNAQAVAERINLTSKDTTLCWLPLTHNLALLGNNMTTTYVSCNQVIMPTSDFLVNPLSWFKEASNRKVTVTVSPNFGYKHFLTFYEKSKQDFDWDLSSLRAVCNGAEPISYDLAIMFMKELEKYNMSNTVMVPGYGMSECTVACNATVVGIPLNTKSINRDKMNIGDRIEETTDTTNATFVSVGSPLSCVEMRITDNQGKVLPDGYIGNIEVSGGTVMAGYYKDMIKTSEVFTSDNWLKTGDVGFMLEGELFVTGRSKEIIFIAGKNYFPNDFEKIIEDKFPSLKNRIAITGVYNAEIETEQIVLYMDTCNGDFDNDLISGIRRYFAKITRLQIEHVRFINGLPRTQNGKIKHYLLKEIFMAKNDDVSANVKTNQKSNIAISAFDTLANVCKEELELITLNPNDNLFEIGADSLKASIILARVNEIMRINLTLNQLYKCETIEDIAKLAEQERQKSGGIDIDFRCNEKVSIPVSAQQKRMYTLFSVDPDNTNYNITAAFQIKGKVDIKKIEETFIALIKRHEALRTVFSFEDNQVRQTVLDNIDFSVEVKKYVSGDIDELVKSCIRSFDLTKAPLFSVSLIEQDKDCVIMVIDMHHIITDGTAMGLLVKDFVKYYNGQSLPDIKYNYRDYAVWQNTMRAQGRFELQRTFWHGYLEGRSTVLALPIDVPKRPKYINKIGDNVIFDIPVSGIAKLAKSTSSSSFNVLFSAYCILLSRYANQKNVVVGTPVAARTKASFLDVVGLFVNTTPYNVNIDFHETVRDFIKRIHSMSINILANQDYQLDWIVDELHIKRESNHSPLFDVMFTMENMEVPPMQMADCHIQQLKLQEDVCKFDLNLIVTEHKDGSMDGNLVYATELYNRSSIENMVKHYLTVLDAMVTDPDAQIGELSIISEAVTRNTSVVIPDFDF